MARRVIPSLLFWLIRFDASRSVASFGVTSFVRPIGTYYATTTTTATTALWGKKAKRKGQGPPQVKQSVQDARFDAMTRQFMFTLVGLTKRLPDKSKNILQDIHLSFYPGAKIGVVGLNGSGKSTLLKIMAGLDTEFDGTARPLPGASIGYLSQEPELTAETVQECIDQAVASSQAILDEFQTISMKLGDPDLTPEEMERIMTKTDQLNNKIEAANLWELERIVSRAQDSLRLPPGDALTKNLSGGEKRRVALCQLLLANHDMLLLDEPTNHLGKSIDFCRLFVDGAPTPTLIFSHFSFI